MSRHQPHRVYRDGVVHVQAEMCSTCIFRKGNLMDLASGRVSQMVKAALEDGSAIVCHQTLPEGTAVCRGFYDRWPTPALKLAGTLGVLVEDEP